MWHKIEELARQNPQVMIVLKRWKIIFKHCHISASFGYHGNSGIQWVGLNWD